MDADKLRAFLQGVRASDRVSDRVRHKTDQELLDHYLMAHEGCLTHLGVLWLGQRNDRAVLRYAPVIQCIRYDEQGQ